MWHAERGAAFPPQPEDQVPAPQKTKSFRMAVGPAHEEELRCIRRFGRDVVPAFS
jgi:hypothetical protein